MSHGLAGVRKAAREHKGMKFTALLHRVTIDLLRDSFGDNLDKAWMIKFVEHRVADRRILRLIQKWLKAGVLEEGK